MSGLYFNIIWNIALIFNSTQVAIHALMHMGVATETEERPSKQAFSDF